MPIVSFPLHFVVVVVAPDFATLGNELSPAHCAASRGTFGLMVTRAARLRSFGREW